MPAGLAHGGPEALEQVRRHVTRRVRPRDPRGGVGHPAALLVVQQDAVDERAERGGAK